jgi:uncharacterized protein
MVTAHGSGVRVAVHVVPRAAESRVLGVHGERLKVSLAAPPVDGAANAELVAFFARALGVAKRDVELVAGETSRKKTLAIAGVGVEQVLALVP